MTHICVSQAPSLASLSGSNRRAPAGFNFDLDALLDVPSDTGSRHGAADELAKIFDRQALSKVL